MLKILIKNKRDGKTRAYQFTQNAILIGRQQNCDITLDSTKVSRRHAKLSVQGNLCFIEDLGSGNGTVVNNKRIETAQRIQLKKNDAVSIEEFEIKIDFTGFALATGGVETASQIKTAESTDPEIIEVKMIKKVLGAMDQEKMPHIVMASPGFENQRALFAEGIDEITVGRDPDCGLSLDSQVVSRKHAVIMVKWGGFVVKDLGSKNGVFVNGLRVQEKTLKDGDQITFGTLNAVFRNPQEFDLENFTKKLKEKKDRETQVQIPLPKDVGVSEAAKASTTTTGTKPVAAVEPKDEKKAAAKEKSEKEKKEVEEILKDTEAKTDVPTKEPGAKKAKKYTKSELILFGFGGLVILIALVVLILLFL